MSQVYQLIGRFFAQKQPPTSPKRVLILKPCCIGDVVMATALLMAIRRTYPQAHLIFAVGTWSIGALDGQNSIDTLLDIGTGANPAKSIGGMWRLVRLVRAQQCDMVFVPDRSPLLGIATWLARIPHRIGLDSDGRGFAYTVRAQVQPDEEINEAEIYLRLANAVNIAIDNQHTQIDIPDHAQTHIEKIIAENNIAQSYIVIHPAGGANPGMMMSSKRWLPHYFAQLATWLHGTYGATIVLIGANSDTPIIQAVIENLHVPYHDLTGQFNLMQIGALGKNAMLYIGNDTGLTHLVAATGAKTAMILGPSSPKRYAPYHPNALALWKPVDLPTGGVAQLLENWDWERDGIGVDAVISAIAQFVSGGATGGEL
ncbi:MAG: glycosyltransferase family 9 protein [Anaerolineae bacterium]|nr:glycosyltransferase family 9 protein [Anaerolineae bacterium]